MFDRRLITHFNWPLLLIVLILSIMGLINLYSATSTFDAQSQTTYFHAQIVWSLVGLVSLFPVISVHYRHFRGMSYFFYGISIILLIAVLVIGKKISGHQSWLMLGPIRLQPTEIAKLGLIFGLSQHLAQLRTLKGATFKDLLPSLFLFLLPTTLVILQGDLGSSLFFGLIYITLVLIYGVRWKVIVTMVVLGITLITTAYLFFLSPYQKGRIQTFLNPESDRRGAGYHLIQSKIAVGSGRIIGRGYLKGKTHKLRFIPERHTAFIFPVLAEEWGFKKCPPFAIIEII